MLSLFVVNVKAVVGYENENLTKFLITCIRKSNYETLNKCH